MRSTQPKPRVVVVGCGVSGLTTGILLLEKGFKVRIITEERPDEEASPTSSEARKRSKIASLAAAAVWYPYSVLPQKQKSAEVVEASVTGVEAWAEVTYQKLEELASEPKQTGVSFVRFAQVYESKREFKEIDRAGLLWWRRIVRKYEHPAPDLPRGYEFGYEVEVPLMDTSVYLEYLMSRFTELGGEIELTSGVKLEELTRKHSLVVNCTGVWARDFCEHKLDDKEKVTAKRGQVVRIQKIGTVERCLLHIGKDEKGEVLTYIIPRSNDCLLGGTATADWNLDPVGEVRDSILERCKALEPSLQNLKPEDILEDKVGLRPARNQVRLVPEMIGQSRVIHNYGHGGDGFTLSWGCAEEVVRLATRDFR